jgi:glutamyl-tRNA synthetase
MIAWFDIADINKAPARLDPKKMDDVNSHYIRQAGDEELLRHIQAFLREADGGPELAAAFDRVGWGKLVAALPSLKGRAKTLKELMDGARYLIAVRPISLDEKAAKTLDAGARAVLGRLLPRLEASPDWQAPALEGVVRTFSEAEAIKLGAIAQPLRAALTGTAVSPPVFDVMAALGRDEALARIRDVAS